MAHALLFAIDLAIGLFTVSGLQKGTDQMVKFGSKWNITCNPHTTKVMQEENWNPENVGTFPVKDWLMKEFTYLGEREKKLSRMEIKWKYKSRRNIED